MNSTEKLVQIHEFSTGIRPQQTTDGGWVSLGFTGQYINATIAPIPHSVQRAIANNEFKIAEGAASDEPALVGRVVKSPQDSDWSVVAVATKGQDEKGRSASFYRYFLCEGEDSLWKILIWMETTYKQQMGRSPIFHPYEMKELGKPNEYQVSTPPQINLSPENEALLRVNAPILLGRERPYTPRLINKIAAEKARLENKPVSWAFNAEGLEKPWNLLVIHPASDRAYQILQKVIANPPMVPLSTVADEQALKSAIKSLMSSSQVKREAVGAIAEVLGNEQVPPDFWHSLFDGQGARNALNQRIYSDQMVRLLSLRILAIPETLPEFLRWLNFKASKEKPDKSKDKLDNLQLVCLEFQSAFYSQFPGDKIAKLESQLNKGIGAILPLLLKQQIAPEAVCWLLRVRRDNTWRNIWEKSCTQLFKDIEYDLQVIGDYFTSYQQPGSVPGPLRCGNDIWRDLIGYWQQVTRIDAREVKPVYKPLADFCYQLRKRRLSAYFYQVSEGQVPKKLYNKAFRTTHPCSFLGLYLYPEETWIEQIGSLLYGNLVIVIPAFILVILAGFVGAVYLITQEKTAPIITDKPEQLKLSADDRKAIALAIKEGNWKKTRTSVRELLNKISQREDIFEADDLTSPTERVKVAIVQSICRNGDVCLDYDAIEEDISDKQASKAWAEEIYFYQQKVKVDTDGIIVDETSRILEGDILVKFIPDYLPVMSPEQEDEALKKFKITRREIREIIDELERGIRDEFRKINSKEVRNKIITEIKNTLISQNQQLTLSYGGGIIEGKWEKRGEKELIEFKKDWIQAIYRYQKKRLNAYDHYGYLEPESPTVDKLKSDVGGKVRSHFRSSNATPSTLDNERNIGDRPSITPPVATVETTPITSFNSNLPSGMTQSIKEEALRRFDTTIETIEQMIEDIEWEKPDLFPQRTTKKKIRNQIIQAMKRILQIPDIQYVKAVRGNPKEKEKLVYAIYLYQQRHQELVNAGYLNPNADTIQFLKKDAIRELAARRPLRR